MKRLIPLLLAIVMVVSVFAACNDTPPETGESIKETPKNDATGNKDTNATTPAETDPEDNLPEDQKINLDLDALDYGGRDFFIYHWTTITPEFDVDEEAAEGDPVNNALYLRNLRMEENLGIKIDFHGEKGNDQYQDQFVSRMKTRIQDPETPVDLIAEYSRAAPHVLVEGLAVDLEAYSDDLDLSKAWWPELVREEHEIRGRLFYTSGDASTGLLTQMEVMFLNKTIFKSLGNDYDAFMNQVKEGNWTLDMLMQLTQGVYQDVDGVNGKSEKDLFGLEGSQINISDGLWTGMGYRLFSTTEEGDSIYALSDDMVGEKAADYVKMMTEWSKTNDICIAYEGGENHLHADKHTQRFAESLTLFMMMRIGNYNASIVEVDYTILPIPKGTATQERYYTCVGNPYTLYSICSSSTDKDLVAQVLQTMGYFGYNLTTPAIFEVTFKGKVAKDDYAVAMFDIIREHITFDIGRTFDRITNTMLPNLISGAICDGASWSSRLTANKKKIFNTSISNVGKKIVAILDITE